MKLCAVPGRSVMSDSVPPMDWSLPGSSVHEDSPSKNTGVGCHCNDICHMIYFSDVISLGCSGKESACHAGDPSLIPGSGRSPGEGIGYPAPVFLGFPGWLRW